MIILQSDIAAFGKLKEKQLSLRPGMNVITGDNESGKTTIAAFLRAMLFGLEADSADYDRWYPREFTGAFGGTMKVLSDGAFYRIERSFLKESPDLRIIKLSDESVLEAPEEWLRKAVGEITEKAYAESGYVPQGALVKEIDSRNVSAEEEAEYKKEADIRAKFEKAKEKLLSERAAYMSKVDAGLPVRMVRNAEELKEREALKTTLSEKLKKAEQELQTMENGLQKDSARIREENDAVLLNLKDNMQKAKAELSLSVRETGKSHRAGAALGTIFITLGLLLGFLTRFYMASEKLKDYMALLTPSTKTEIICAGGFGGAALLLLSGLILAIVNSAKRSRAKKALKKQDGLRAAVESAEKAYQDGLNERETEKVRVDHEEERTSRVSELREEVITLSEEIIENTTRFEALLSEGTKDEERSREQEKAEKEIRAIDLALRSFEHLSETPASKSSPDACSQKATEYFSLMDGSRALLVNVSPAGAVHVVQDGLEKPVSDLSLGTAEEVLLAARLAIFDAKDPAKRLPVILDDAFSGFDESRLNSAMNLLRSIGRQAVLLSCQTRERQKL